MAKTSPRRGSSLPAAIWVSGFILGTVFLACLLILISTQCRLEALRGELSQLRREVRSAMHGTAGGQDAPRPCQSLGNLPERSPTQLERRRRDTGRTPQDSPRPRPRRKQSVLHLAPLRHSNSEDGFATEIWWKPFLQQGRALELSGRDVMVRHTGLYFVYSQVLFHDPTFTMGQVLWREAPGKPGQILFRCVQSMPPNPEKAFNSCYSGGIFHLQPGDRLNLRIPRFNASFDLTGHGTFLGFLRL
ncbi:tumor necrosis factor ligand superfamily member 13 [Zootoca vivipara]|uniref:tumor necrosis factor ligand superfamily member 13 n=1 Tax=Zootoca vivipara TaxID=8524 RepID=UPI00293B9612|nr:tumor necrosis factor ligand superfamily member 13 [Zootoca vivipara]